MSLIKVITAKFEKALTEVFKRESEDKNYMNQSILGCRWRAFWGIVVAFNKARSSMVKVGALSIAKHREKKHGEDKTRTINSLTRSMSSEQIKASEASSGWSM